MVLGQSYFSLPALGPIRSGIENIWDNAPMFNREVLTSDILSNIHGLVLVLMWQES